MPIFVSVKVSGSDERIEDGAFGTVDEDDVLFRPHTRGDRPHHVVHVEDVDVVVDDDNVFRIELGAERGHDRHLRLAFGNLLHGNDRHESAAGLVRDVHRADIRQVAAKRILDFTFAGDARNQDMVFRHARRHTMEDGVTPHADPMRDKNVLRAAIGGVAGKFAERTFRLSYAGENFTLDNDFSAGGNLNTLKSTIGNSIRLAKQTADDLVSS